MTVQEQSAGAKGPGQRGRGDREGFSFDDGRGRGRDDRGRGGRREGGGAGFRVVNELSTLEKALTKGDLAAQRLALDDVLKAVRSLGLKSLDALDANARGRLITSLARVVRQPKPKPPAQDEGGAVQETKPAEGGEAAEAVPAAAEGAEAPPEPKAPPPAPAPPSPIESWTNVVFSVGLVWRAAGDVDRAAAAFALGGREPTPEELEAAKAGPAPAAPATAHAPKRERERAPRSERRDRPPRVERQVSRFPTPVLFVPTGDWQADVKKLEEMGRTRDAGRMHEKNKSFADAARLFAIGGDLKSAYRCAALGDLEPLATELSAKLKPDEIIATLERAEAWEKLMAFHVGRQDFEAVARLYERARQFDQAAIAWERAGKLAAARRSFERSGDAAAARRIMHLEVEKLVERGDRLGAATLLVGAGLRAEAAEVLKPLPPPKAHHFMEKLQLTDEARAYARQELEVARAAGNLLHLGRWHEALGEDEEAIAAYLSADRKDKAAAVHERRGELPKAAALLEGAGQLDRAEALYKRAGDTTSAARVAALPRPVQAPPAAPEEVAATEAPSANAAVPDGAA